MKAVFSNIVSIQSSVRATNWGLSVGKAVLGTLELWMNRIRQRQALARLDDRLLRDVGLSREIVDAEANKPFWRP